MPFVRASNPTSLFLTQLISNNKFNAFHYRQTALYIGCRCLCECVRVCALHRSTGSRNHPFMYHTHSHSRDTTTTRRDTPHPILDAKQTYRMSTDANTHTHTQRSDGTSIGMRKMLRIRLTISIGFHTSSEEQCHGRHCRRIQSALTHANMEYRFKKKQVKHSTCVIAAYGFCATWMWNGFFGDVIV